MVFQTYALFPQMTVAANIGYGLKVRRVAPAERDARVARNPRDDAHQRARARAASISFRAASVSALHWRGRVAMRPRVAAARRAADRARRCIARELRAEIDALLRGLGITAVYVTHDQTESMVLGDRIIVMEKGRIAQVGSAKDIYFHPRTRFVAEFIGTMNRLEGTIRDGCFETAAGRMPVDRPDTAQVVAFFRPESAALADPMSAPFRLTVERVHFLGANQRVQLRAGEAVITVDTDNRRAIVPGTDVGVSIAGEDLLFL